MEVFGIDIGGSGVKGAPVDVATGRLTAERFRVPTPQPSTPDAVAGAVATVAGEFGGTGPVGITFPRGVVDGKTMTAANVDHDWIGLDARELFAGRLGAPVSVINDAD